MATVTSTKRHLDVTSDTYQSNGNVVIGGDLTVNGSTTTLDTQNLIVEDKNIIIGQVSTPSDTTADGGGITLKGATDKTIYWSNSDDEWKFNQGIEITSGIITVSGGTSTQWNTAYGWGDHSAAGYLTGVTNISGYSGTLLREDNRTISPSELTSGRLKFGFTSWNNNNTSPYADFIHMRSYTDSSGGSDNLVMFKKNGIGMRLWQQTYGSATAYSSYADVWTSNDFTSTNVSNWNTAYSWGDHSGLYAAASHTHAAGDITSGTLDSARIPSPTSGDWWNNGYVKVLTDGVMEVGKYFDMHATDTATSDYDVRLTASTGSLAISGDLVVSGGDITLSGTGRIQGIDTVSAGTDAVNKTYVDTNFASSSHNHDSRYTSIDASGDNYTFELEDESSFSGNRWYHVATIPNSRGGLHIRGAILNHVETFASQKLDLAIQAREGNDGGQLEIAGTVDVFHNATTGTDKCGVRVIKTTDTATYDEFKVYVRVTRYQQLTLRLTQQGSVTFNTNHSSPLTSEPAPVAGGHVEIDTSTYTEGHHVIVDSTNSITVSGGDITLGGTGRIQGVDTVSAGTDAVNKTYVDTNFASSSHTHAASDITSGTFADARIALSNITQHTDPKYLRSDAADTATGQLFFDAGFDSHPIMLSGSQNFDNIDRSGFYNLYNTHTGSTNSPGFPYGTMIAIGNDKGGQGFGLQIAHERTGTGMYVRGMNDTASAWSAWAEIWTSTTDGAGSGLDADLLDGQQGSYYAAASSLGSYLPLAGGTMTGDLYLDDGSGATPSLYFKNGADNFWRYLMESGGDFSVKEGTSTRLTFQAGGYVGIGETNPSYPLDVSGTVKASSFRVSASDPGVQFEDSAGSTYEGLLRYRNNALEWLWGGGMKLRVSSDGGMAISQGYSTSSIPTSGLILPGNVGIGTDSPGQKLHVAGNIYATGQAQAANAIMKTYSGYAMFGSNSSTVPVAIGRDAANLDLIINSSGKVGIGETNLGAKLHVDGDIISTDKIKINGGHSSTRLQLYYDYGAGDTNDAQLLLWASEPGITYSGVGIGANIDTEGHYYGRYSTLGGYGVIMRMRPDNGNIEFATTTSAVNTSGATWSTSLKITPSGGLTMQGNNVWHAGNDGAGSGLDADLLDGQQGSYYAAASHNHDSDYVNVTGDTMTGTLDVHVNDSGTILKSGNSSAVGTPDQFFIKHNLGNVEVGNNRGNINITNGNVGIGTTSPFTTGGTAKLTIAANSAISWGASNTDMSYFRRLSAGEFQWQTYNSGNTGEIHLQPYGGNVGIGTTSPAYKLDVAGAIGINTYIHHNDDTDTFIGFASPDVFLVNVGNIKQLNVTDSNVEIKDTLSFTYPTANNEYNGEIVTFGTFVSSGTPGNNGTISAGDVIVYMTNGLASGWTRAQGSTAFGKGMLGIAMGTSPSDGILIKGFARNIAFASGGLGSPLYLDPSNAGDTTSTIPSSTNNIVRIVGYMLNPTNDEIFFDPDKSWVQVS